LILSRRLGQWWWGCLHNQYRQYMKVHACPGHRRSTSVELLIHCNSAMENRVLCYSITLSHLFLISFVPCLCIHRGTHIAMDISRRYFLVILFGIQPSIVLDTRLNNAAWRSLYFGNPSSVKRLHFKSLLVPFSLGELPFSESSDLSHPTPRK
jgi:hypothetical protein